eukprot:11892984-Alexandrium_andersonii.AAC.1
MCAHATGPPARARRPHRTCAKRSLHMQSPAVPTTARGNIAMTPATMMAAPSLLEAFVRWSP